MNESEHIIRINQLWKCATQNSATGIFSQDKTSVLEK
jgi:uncharacterized membrane-anchored protein YitT (DUF2179 family)